MVGRLRWDLKRKGFRHAVLSGWSSRQKGYQVQVLIWEDVWKTQGTGKGQMSGDHWARRREMPDKLGRVQWHRASTWGRYLNFFLSIIETVEEFKHKRHSLIYFVKDVSLPCVSLRKEQRNPFGNCRSWEERWPNEALVKMQKIDQRGLWLARVSHKTASPTSCCVPLIDYIPKAYTVNSIRKRGWCKKQRKCPGRSAAFLYHTNSLLHYDFRITEILGMGSL